MAIYHKNITDPYLHEPKGVSSASAGTVYVADGAGSGDWVDTHSYINGYIAFDSVTPAYQHSVTTTLAPLNPTFSVSLSKNFTGSSSPNARLTYTGTADVVATINFNLNFKNNSGTNRNLELVFYKNGSTLNGGHVISTAVAGEWKAVTLADQAILSTNDYIEVFVKADDAFTLDVASGSLIISGDSE